MCLKVKIFFSIDLRSKTAIFFIDILDAGTFNCNYRFDFYANSKVDVKNMKYYVPNSVSNMK